MPRNNMLRTLIAGLLGFLIGLSIMLVIYPFIFSPPVLNEKISNIETKTAVATGEFIHPNPRDFIHYGQGTVTVYRSNKQYEIFLNKNFKVGPGPAFHIYLSEAKNIKTNSSFQQAKKYDLGMLKSFQGSQVYVIPSQINMSKIRSIVVWCVTFSQLITSANLNK